MSNKTSEPVMAVMPSDIATAYRPSSFCFLIRKDSTDLVEKVGVQASPPFSKRNLLPGTVNYHFTSACNMRCKFCFADFRDCREASLSQHKGIIRAIASARPLPGGMTRRINFVGGEPTVNPLLGELVAEAINCGLRASMVTNGYMLARSAALPDYVRHLELVGVSIDSLNGLTNLRNGRAVNGQTVSAEEWFGLFDKLTTLGVKIKINTVVGDFNCHENLSAFILKAKPNLLRWKVLQAMPVEGQNCDSLDMWDQGVTADRFNEFVKRHRHAEPVVESESLMRGSYVMISPDGRFFDSTTGHHRYSSPILTVGLDAALSEISFDEAKFRARGGTADFETGRSARQTRITLSGFAGSGKTTVGSILSERMDAPLVSAGKFAREVAESEFGVSINEFQKLSADDPKLDARVDTVIQEWCAEMPSFIADYRLGFKFVPNAFSVLLTVSDHVAVGRIQAASRKGEDTDAATICERNEMMRARFLEKYGVDFTDPKHYDLIVPTDAFTPSEIADMILAAASR